MINLKIKLKKIFLFSAFFLLLVIMVFAILYNFVITSTEEIFVSDVVDAITTEDFKITHKVYINYTILHFKNATLDSSYIKYENIFLGVAKYSIEQPDVDRYGLLMAARNLKFKNSSKILTTSGIKTRSNWDVFKPGEFIFPSGRLFLSGKDLYLVLFVNGKCNLYIKSIEGYEFKIENPIAKRRDLFKLWSASFSPDDIFWNYCLVTNCEFFGVDYKNQFDENIYYWNIDLYNEYMKIKNGNLKNNF
jgi:hypothetical protein